MADGRAGWRCRRARSSAGDAGVPWAMTSTPVGGELASLTGGPTPARPSACTSSTTRSRIAGSVSGRTPWPRLKMWPGWSPACSSTARVSAVDHVPGGQAQGGIEVALDGDAGSDPSPGLVEGDPPVHAHHRAAGLGHRRQQLAGADAEEDGGHVRVGRRPAPRRARRVAGSTNSSVVARGRGCRPNCRRPGRQRPRRPAGTASEATARSPAGPTSACQIAGSVCMSALTGGEVRDGPPFDQVAGHGERRRRRSR